MRRDMAPCVDPDSWECARPASRPFPPCSGVRRKGSLQKTGRPSTWLGTGRSPCRISRKDRCRAIARRRPRASFRVRRYRRPPPDWRQEECYSPDRSPRVQPRKKSVLPISCRSLRFRNEELQAASPINTGEGEPPSPASKQTSKDDLESDLQLS